VDGWVGILVLMALGAGLASVMVWPPACSDRAIPTPEKLAPYECGMPAVGDARERQSVKFYLVAMIFLLFDIEIAFLFPWAMALRALGWYGFVQMTFFLILTVGFVYVWRKGLLDWGPLPRVVRRGARRRPWRGRRVSTPCEAAASPEAP
jgi:NADH-quinone oxidoreductase subunit A